MMEKPQEDDYFKNAHYARYGYPVNPTEDLLT
jgi:hypothetical protein